jgi:tetratricopeptide (TPR) repeat protein
MVRSVSPGGLAAALLGLLAFALPRLSSCAPGPVSASEPDITAPSASAVARKHPLAASDTVVLADFENRTGDAIFDNTLRQALALELEESPFVSVLGDRQTRAALQAAGLPPGLTLTVTAGRKVCARTGSRAVLRGTISRTGGGYRLDLAALGCASGVELAHARGEAPGQAGVLKALRQAASSLRAQLGEPAASVRRYQAPAGTTTAALGALKSYSLGLAVQRDHGDDPSIPDFQRAIQLDPRLAVAYASLAAVYRNLRQPSRALQFATRAYALRARAGGREAFRIATVYFLATGRLDEETTTYRQWAATYPRDFLPRNDLGNDYAAIGKSTTAEPRWRSFASSSPSRASW